MPKTVHSDLDNVCPDILKYAEMFLDAVYDTLNKEHGFQNATECEKINKTYNKAQDTMVYLFDIGAVTSRMSERLKLEKPNYGNRE